MIACAFLSGTLFFVCLLVCVIVRVPVCLCDCFRVRLSFGWWVGRVFVRLNCFGGFFGWLVGCLVGVFGWLLCGCLFG